MVTPRKSTTRKPDPDREYEVLVEKPNGHRAVHRVRAASEDAAARQVEELFAADPPAGRHGHASGPVVLHTQPVRSD